MSNPAPVPCIICDKVVYKVFEGVENQPYEATNFQSYGQYGSTTWDPFDGSYLEINICDTCMREKAAAGKILVTRSHRPIIAAGTRYLTVGREIVDRPFMIWKGPEEELWLEDDVLYVEPEEVGTDMGRNVEWLSVVRDFPDDWQGE